VQGDLASLLLPGVAGEPFALLMIGIAQKWGANREEIGKFSGGRQRGTFFDH
jgi:hypothetical protein